MHSLFINTMTTIITFILVFSIQGVQNRDARALHRKLNELMALHEETLEKIKEIEEELDDDDD